MWIVIAAALFLGACARPLPPVRREAESAPDWVLNHGADHAVGKSSCEPSEFLSEASFGEAAIDALRKVCGGRGGHGPDAQVARGYVKLPAREEVIVPCDLGENRAGKQAIARFDRDQFVCDE